MEKKLVPYPVPGLVFRQNAVRSTKPPGVNSAPPIWNERGDSFGFSTSCPKEGLVDLVGGAARLALTRTGVPFTLVADSACGWALICWRSVSISGRCSEIC